MASVDPNKYSRNKNIKPESNLTSMFAIGRMLLMLIGIVGITMELFRENGWLKTGLAKLFETTTNMMLIPVIIFVLWALNRWMTSPNKAETSRSGDLPMYLMMGAGGYYVFRLITTGSL